jgi:hypothetical protein
VLETIENCIRFAWRINRRERCHDSDAWHPCRCAAAGKEVKWVQTSKRMAFRPACRAALGDLLSKEELDAIFPLSITMGQGTFSPVWLS